MSSALSFILLIIGISRGAVLDTCNYVQPADYQPTYAVDVCRTHVTGGTPEYRKYICDASGQIQDEIWDTATCDVNVLSTETPSSLITFNCANHGDCEYFMLANYPNGCANYTDNYSEQPVISGVCVEIPDSVLVPPHSWYWTCADQSINHQIDEADSAARAGACAAVDTVQSVGLGSGCEFLSFQPYLGSWEGKSNCMTIRYASQSPTKVPTTSPTEMPSTPPSETPSKAPTEMPSTTPTEMPSESPTKFPTAIPSVTPTKVPSETPTESPSEMPSETPTEMPSESPTKTPSANPTKPPTKAPKQPGSAAYIGLIVNGIIGLFMGLAV